jgi:PiT family inorganic phosphate transporter
MLTIIVLLLITLTLSAANGANDNVKGVATLIGSGLSDYRRAIVWATAATAMGGGVSLFVANGLLQAFGGHGIVPDAVASSPGFLAAVGLGAGATVWLATRLGQPVSTTHALLGALVGAGWAASPQVRFGMALHSIAAPLLISPVVALVSAFSLMPWLHRLRIRSAAIDPTCICTEPAEIAADGSIVGQAKINVGRRGTPACNPPAVEVAASSPLQWLDGAHVLSALAVSFARGLNDTPKIAALLVAAGGLGARPATVTVIVAMAIGGLIAARRVADTLAYKITRMDPAEGLGGNLVTATLVIVASRFGMPVSTTHVSAGALFGIATGNRSGRARVIAGILGAWLLTLPLAAGIAAALWLLM